MAELVKKYQQYEEYKETGIEWLGKIPSSWRTGSLRWMIDIASGESLPSNCEKEYSKENQFPVVGGNGVMGFSNKVNTADAAIAVGRVGALCGNIHSIDYDSWITDNALKISKWNKFSKDFLVYLLKTANLNDLASKTAQPLITGEQVKSLKVVLLPIAEQKKIANFLDHETAQIDTLIEKQQTLIQLLKEKRQAVISHAVTKGLNPDAPMKDSGVEWLGEVPEHWVVSPLKLYIDTRKGVAFKSADFTDLGVRVVKASDIKEKTIRQSDVFLPVYFSETYPKAILSEGDIVISTVGSTPDVKNSAVGQIGMVPVELDGSLLNQNTVVFTPRNNILENLFLFYLIQTDVYRDHLDLNAHGTANQASLNVSDMLNFTFARPSFKEQSEISEHIIKVNNSFDALEKNCVTAIQLMQERRTALISAAVTGKIDVRGWRAPE